VEAGEAAGAFAQRELERGDLRQLAAQAQHVDRAGTGGIGSLAPLAETILKRDAVGRGGGGSDGGDCGFHARTLARTVPVGGCIRRRRSIAAKCLCDGGFVRSGNRPAYE